MLSRVDERVDFTGTVFSDPVMFSDVTFRRDVIFSGAVFLSDAMFGTPPADQASRVKWRAPGGTSFAADVDFAAAEFRGDLLFEYVLLGGDCNFMRADFHNECRIDIRDYWLELAANMDPEEAPDLFHEADERSDDRQAVVSFKQARFRDGAIIELLPGMASFATAEIGDSVQITISGSLELDHVAVKHPIAVLADRHPGTGQPEISSLSGATIQAPLMVGEGVALHRCRFGGTIGLDRLQSPAGRLRLTHLAGRQVLADEIVWRAYHQTRQPRRPVRRMLRMPDWVSAAEEIVSEEVEFEEVEFEEHQPCPAVADPSMIAGLYRQLRQGLEAANNAPGAADFYYGEMEMRRSAATGIERPLLALYCLVAGYGTRASRALATCLAVLTGSTALLRFGPRSLRSPCSGAACPDWSDYWETFVFLTRWSVSLLPTPEVQGLSTMGQAVLIVVRLLVPLLVALTVIAVRSRIQR